ncbi:MAG: tetratricopeptide repeat protein [Bacteroidota bacterium]
MRSLLMLIFCVLFTHTYAQNMSWRKHAKLAEKQYEAGNYAEAAVNFEAAWKKKTKKKKYIYRAAECYYQLKSYRKAAECYNHVKEDNEDFELPGLKYCRSLKMDGQYDEASRAFVYFINGYNGKDKSFLAAIVQDEILGCELGMALLENTDEKNITIEHLSENVNSKGSDFAPIPFGDDVLYYTSNMVGESKMYITRANEGIWGRSKVPKNFPKIAAPHFGNGAFSPDNKRFFYTQCETVDATGRMLDKCMIYYTERSDAGWSVPQKLGSTINRTEGTSTHPFVVHRADEEILYFVSDRKGGAGGLDVWYATRQLADEKIKFGTAKNLGTPINTAADEISPYFDVEEQTFYFSSNGGINIGGYDIFQSKKEGDNQWAAPTHLGLPFNSSADDYYFRKYSMNGGYVVSNRKFGLNKTRYGDDDIFAFSIPIEKMMVSGQIKDKATNEPLMDAEVAIYEVKASGDSRLLESKNVADAQYEFGLLAGKNYRVEASKPGFQKIGTTLSTIDNTQKQFAVDFELTSLTNNTTISEAAQEEVTIESDADESFVEAEMETENLGTADGTFSNPQPNAEMDNNESYATNGSTSELPSTTNTEYPNNTEAMTAMNENENVNEATAAVVYKIQLVAVRQFDSSDARFDMPSNYGELQTEYLPKRKLTRVLLATFDSEDEAEQVLATLKASDSRTFKTSVVVRYENGVRIDPWQR